MQYRLFRIPEQAVFISLQMHKSASSACCDHFSQRLIELPGICELLESQMHTVAPVMA
jgi:hypothetical protein